MIKELRYLLLIALVIFAYGSFNIHASISRGEPLYLIWTVFCYLAVMGLLLKKSWSKYLVYLLAIVTTSGWAYFTYYMYINNWPQYESPDILQLFTLGAFLMLTSLWFSVYVHKYFSNKP